jgi:hypothetical protein
MFLYVPGMRLGGSGTNPYRGRKEGKLGNSRAAGLQVYNQSGSGTSNNPTVAWLFDVETHENIPPPMRQAHVEIARQVARANGFNCILIRKEAHDERCIYNDDGTRVTMTLPTGQQRSVTVRADLHMTVYMGPDVRKAWVSGHIYLLKVWCPRANALIVQQMDDPARQRSIVRPDLQPVAEEFWLTSGTLVLQYPDSQQTPPQRHIHQTPTRW